MKALTCPSCKAQRSITDEDNKHYLAFDGNHQNVYWLYEYICGECGFSFFAHTPIEYSLD